MTSLHILISRINYMGKEYEAKFLDVDVDRMKLRLKGIGATLDHPRKKIR